jgi:hypothetical protein
LSGSLRAGSFNAGLLRAAAEVAADETDVIIGTIRGMPLYDGDVGGAAGIPAEASVARRWSIPAYRCAHAGYLLTKTGRKTLPGLEAATPLWIAA